MCNLMKQTLKQHIYMYGVQGSILTQGGKQCVHFANTGDSRRFDNEFHQHINGINDNSFIRVLDHDMDEDNELNCPQIISHSSYYDLEKLSIILQTCKNKFTIFGTNI